MWLGLERGTDAKKIWYATMTTEFSEKQLQQFQALLAPLAARLSHVDARLSDIDKQQGGLWETSVRQSVQNQVGHSFSKEFAVVSLQHLAKLVCRSTGWSYGSDAVDICRVAEKLANAVLTDAVAESLLRGVFEALVESADGKGTFADVGRRLQADPWFDEAGRLDTAALGRSLPAFAEEESKHLKNKLQKVHRCLALKEGITNSKTHFKSTCLALSSVIQAVCSGRMAHLLTCRSAGVLLALYAAEPSKYDLRNSFSFSDLTQKMPCLQLQLDVRGKVTMINNKVTIEVGEIKRNLKQYKEAKLQLVQRAKVLQWAMSTVVDQHLEFVLIGHLFVPRGKPDDNIPDNEIAGSVSTFTHQL